MLCGALALLAVGAVSAIPETVGASAANETTVTLTGGTIKINQQTATSVTVDGLSETLAYDMQDGASVRLNETTGIRFTSFLSKADYEGLKAEYGAGNVEIGSLVTKNASIAAADFVYDASGVTAMPASLISIYDETAGNEVLRFCTAIDKIPEDGTAYDTDVCARSYVKITTNDNTYYGYTDYDDENCRNIDEVATGALLDTQESWDDSKRYILEDFAADKVAGTVTVDTSSATWVTAFGATATKATEANDTAKTATQVTQAALETFDNETAGNEAARTKTLTVYTDSDVYKTDSLLVSKIITTKDELLNWQSYTQKGKVNSVEGTTTNDNVTYTRYRNHWAYDGYVVLGADIPLTVATSYELNTSTNIPTDVVATEGFRVSDTSQSYAKDYGFKGTFDGRGYTISGGAYGAGGLFGGVAESGVIKNLAIVNAAIVRSSLKTEKLNDANQQTGVGRDGKFNADMSVIWANNALIAQTFCGTMENCLLDSFAISATATNGLEHTYSNDVSSEKIYGNNTNTIFFSLIGDLTNVVIYSDRYDNNSYYSYSLCYDKAQLGTHTNVFLFTDKAVGWSSGTNNAYISYECDEIGGITRGLLTDTVSAGMVTALNGSGYWNLTEGDAKASFITKE